MGDEDDGDWEDIPRSPMAFERLDAERSVGVCLESSPRYCESLWFVRRTSLSYISDAPAESIPKTQMTADLRFRFF